MKCGGQIGNDIFIVSSAWFLLESNLCKVEKVVRIVVDSLVVSVFIIVLLSRSLLFLFSFSEKKYHYHGDDGWIPFGSYVRNSIATFG